MKKIAIIGGGFAALNLAWRLVNDATDKDLSIEIFEKNQQLGGMAAGFKEKAWDWALEKHYHHLFAKDSAFQQLLEELGLANQLFYKKTLTSTRWHDQQYQLDSAWSLLNFKQLSLIDRLRTGAVLAFLKILPNGQFLERYPASVFLQKSMGKNSWQIIWQPLFQAKFANWADEINMAWFWARIKPRTAQLGYVEGGFQHLANQLGKKLTEKGVKIHLQREVQKIIPNDRQTKKHSQLQLSIKSLSNESMKIQEYVDVVISTLPSAQFAKIIDLPELKNKHLQGLAAMTLILRLKAKLLDNSTYWLNINESNWPFVAVVEHDNFIDKKHYGNEHLVYVGRYLSSKDQVYGHSAKELWESYLPFLQKINSDAEKLLIDYRLYKEDFAQPIVTKKHSQHLPAMRTSCPNLYWVSMQHIYPHDRGLNYAIAASNQLIELIKEDSQSQS